MTKFRCREGMYVGGKWIYPELRNLIDVINPATEQVLCTIREANEQDVDKAVSSAALAQKVWGKTKGSERAKYLRKIASKLLERRCDLARIEAINSGKPLAEAECDIDESSKCFEYFAKLSEDLDGCQWETVDVDNQGYLARLRKEPIGVVAAVVPWNYPILIASWKIAPALAAGCTVVLKPSELTPVSALELGQAVHDVGLPPGVLNIITGNGDTGASLVDHRGIEKISFTGSSSTGTKIMRSASERTVPLTLELGGKSAAIVFDDINFERTIEWIMLGCFSNGGQICSATSRLLLHESIAAKFIDLLVQETNKITIGDPLDDRSKMGPLISRAQQSKVLGFIEKAKMEGAKVLCGGKRPSNLSKGWYVEPTILVDIDNTMEIWNAEIFGPVLSIMTFKTEEDVIRLANDSEYGLAAAIFSASESRLDRVTAQIESGVVWQNCSQPVFVQLPWGGIKRSGIGRDLGMMGLESFLQTKQVVRYQSNENLGWYH